MQWTNDEIQHPLDVIKILNIEPCFMLYEIYSEYFNFSIKCCVIFFEPGEDYTGDAVLVYLGTVSDLCLSLKKKKEEEKKKGMSAHVAMGNRIYPS